MDAIIRAAEEKEELEAALGASAGLGLNLSGHGWQDSVRQALGLSGTGSFGRADEFKGLQVRRGGVRWVGELGGWAA